MPMVMASSWRKVLDDAEVVGCWMGTDTRGERLPGFAKVWAVPRAGGVHHGREPNMTNYSAPQPTAGTGEDPGKTLGIVGLVLAFVFALAGIIVSAIALKKSKEAGFKNTIAKVGLILSIVFLVIGIITSIALFAATFAAIEAGVTTY